MVGTAVGFCTLAEGDANNDNQVNIGDFTILVTAFGKSIGQPGFDPRPDFNQSGQINARDFSLLSANFGRYGNQRCP